ncbi:hypothetical protein DAEQUDRAFT_127918 [Daedalea quercina L-15889]|uniref:DUF6535 domain-containing protein n=1 Tax=Daedalea quercina L-15889 TaxID=1314783 RepID=A0A165S059_9APHY|nr:hypothetical protein DAEQUDRAFT_127918 [Daedalea quercina L-15889]
MSALILFAAPFPAVLAAFVVESYQNLHSDPNSTTVVFLQEILAALHSNGSLSYRSPAYASENFQPKASDAYINTLWLASFVISISTAFLVILAKGWLFNLSENSEPIIASATSGTRTARGRSSPPCSRGSPSYSMLPCSSSPRASPRSCSPSMPPSRLRQGCIKAITVRLYIGIHIVPVIDSRTPYKTSVTTALMMAIILPAGEISRDDMRVSRSDHRPSSLGGQLLVPARGRGGRASPCKLVRVLSRRRLRFSLRSYVAFALPFAIGICSWSPAHYAYCSLPLVQI